MSRNGRYLFTSESVTEGHPDKIADQISDAILDAILAQDPVGRVACETLVTTGLAIIAGEITTSCYVDFPKIVRETIKDVGYTRAKFGFDSETCAVLSSIHEQSPDIAQGVDTGRRRRPGPDVRLRLQRDRRADAAADHAGAQARAAACRARGATACSTGCGPTASPRSRSSTTDGTPVRVDTVVVSTQHSPTVTQRDAPRGHHRARSSSRVIPAEHDGQEHADPTSTRPAASSSAARTATPASPAARSSSTPTAARRRTAAARSPARIRRRSIARPATWRATSRRTSSPPGSPSAARCSSPTRSASPSRSRSSSTRSAPAQVADDEDQRARARALRADAARHHRDARPAPADLPEDRRVRPLRPHRAGVHLGAHRQGRGAAR